MKVPVFVNSGNVSMAQKTLCASNHFSFAMSELFDMYLPKQNLA